MEIDGISVGRYLVGECDFLLFAGQFIHTIELILDNKYDKLTEKLLFLTFVYEKYQNRRPQKRPRYNP
jgi:hypothetical protein